LLRRCAGGDRQAGDGQHGAGQFSEPGFHVSSTLLRDGGQVRRVAAAAAQRRPKHGGSYHRRSAADNGRRDRAFRKTINCVPRD
ncbi:MAG TPA: hypothetical protein VK052_07145, partial [Zeimonas sp.]|nr:hypothetical protein [Zeimonas sp.]